MKSVGRKPLNDGKHLRTMGVRISDETLQRFTSIIRAQSQSTFIAREVGRLIEEYVAQYDAQYDAQHAVPETLTHVEIPKET